MLLERCLALEPGKASILEALGRAYLRPGGLRAGRGALPARWSTRTRWPHYAHFGLGLASLRLGDAAAGLRHLRMAVFLKPEIEDYQQALQRLGDAA